MIYTEQEDVSTLHRLHTVFAVPAGTSDTTQ